MRGIRLIPAGIVALGAAVIGAGSAGAQAAPAASPFHAGQWGIEAYATPNNGGLLYFVTNQTALVVGGIGQRATTKQEPSGFPTSKNTSSSFEVSLGLRNHRTFAPGMAFIAGGGAFVGALRQRNEFMGQTTRYRSSYYGGYGEIGGQYMPVSRFAIGLTYRLQAQRSKNKNADLTGVAIGADFTPVRVTLYF